MTVTLTIYRRWSGHPDPVIDCAIQIMDVMNYRSFYDEEITPPEPWWPKTLDDAMFFLWHAAEHLKDGGRCGYVWVDEARMVAADALNRLGNICMHEDAVLRIFRGS